MRSAWWECNLWSYESMTARWPRLVCPSPQGAVWRNSKGFISLKKNFIRGHLYSSNFNLYFHDIALSLSLALQLKKILKANSVLVFQRHCCSFLLAAGLPSLKSAMHFTFTLLDYSLSQQISSVITVAELPINYLTEITALWWTAFLRTNLMKMQLLQEDPELQNCINNDWFLKRLWNKCDLRRYTCFLGLNLSWDICYIFVP